MIEEVDLEKISIERIRMASEMSLRHYEKPIVCTYSGGKDSDVMLELFKRSGVPFEVHNSHTTVDAPQTVYHIREKFKELENLGIKCEIEKPPINKSDPKKRRFTMWSLIVKKKMPPTRQGMQFGQPPPGLRGFDALYHGKRAFQDQICR